METVASHLHSETNARMGSPDRDWFGRSTFNRFYYATFLEVRAALKEMSPDWTNVAHKNIPELLGGSIKTELRRGLERARRTGDGATLSQCSSAIAAAKELAALRQQRIRRA